MKKVICLILLLVSLCSLFAVEDSDKDIKAYMEYLLTEDLNMNLDKISVLSEAIPIYERYDLYKKYQPTSNWPVILNTTVGFGVGSFLMGDKKGGIIGSCWDGGNILLLIIASIPWARVEEQTYTVPNAWGEEEEHTEYITVYERSNVAMALAGLSFAGSRIFQGIRARAYLKSLSENLLGALGLKEFKTGFDPILTPDGNLGLEFKVKIGL